MKILLNHLGFELAGQKIAIIDAPADFAARHFSVYHSESRELAFSGEIQQSGGVDHWGAGQWHYWVADFSALDAEGEYFLVVGGINPPLVSHTFSIAKKLFSEQILSDIVHYIKGQRCTGLYDKADRSRPKWGGEERRDVHGGWYDASGDCSKYLSHLSFANFMNPQQTPQVVWNLLDGLAQLPPQSKWFNERMVDEVLHGADYLVRMQDPAGYFYMTVFDQWSKDENRRDICAYETQKGEKFACYQAGYRQGGGVAIAALARASALQRDGEFSRAFYLQAAQRGFAHLEQYNIEYLDNGVENIIDDYCALLAACELLEVSGDAVYADAAVRRVLNLLERQTAEGWFKADAAGERSYFHAAEAGLPYIALMRFVEVVPSSPLVGRIREALRCAFEYEYKITFASVNNPFGYPRQFVKQAGEAGCEQFFIPHNNGTGYWWQGENARLGSLAAASVRAQVFFVDDLSLVTKLIKYEQAALDWLLGANPFDACMLQGWGRNNPRYEVGFYNAPGGVCNGITSGLDNENDIDFRKSEIATMANSWRWTEQWMPHGAWLFLALSTRIGKN
ncbi:glycoside hydrolase family 9 protein [Iodobacter ciconiae]|uniref:Endoglucanase-like protein n=1 Tax=Iodobacter ciconiae TaxID=2496266 RepID=A0A3S8ZRN2_9NEIS|nr:glycoside hydrolase family 9 protein [Iodobacter ciconiae]AZN36149.1 endoglucanase-like protein [Iodobacter ciconiae]